MLHFFVNGSAYHPWVLYLEAYFWLLLHFGSPLGARLTTLLICRFSLQGHGHVHRQPSNAVPVGVTSCAAAAPLHWSLNTASLWGLFQHAQKSMRVLPGALVGSDLPPLYLHPPHQCHAFQLAAWKAGMILTLKPMSPIWQFGMSPSNLQEANATFISTAFPLMKYFQCSHTATSLVFAFKAVMWKFGLWFWYMHCSWICYEQNLYLNICYKLIIWKHRTPLFFCCCYKFNITRF